MWVGWVIEGVPRWNPLSLPRDTWEGGRGRARVGSREVLLPAWWSLSQSSLLTLLSPETFPFAQVFPGHQACAQTPAMMLLFGEPLVS